MHILKRIIVFLAFFAVAAIPASGFDLDDYKNTVEEKKKVERDFALPKNRSQEEGEAAAARSYDYYHSEDYQEKLAREIERLKKEVFPGVSDYAEEKARQSTDSGVLEPHEGAYIFISSSMPMRTLKNYAASLDKAGDPNVAMVLRGFVGGMKKIMPTARFIQNIIRKNDDCNFDEEKCESYRALVQVDPVLFRLFDIQKVPALVYTQGMDREKGIPGNAFVFYGDVSLQYALELVNREIKSEGLQNLLSKLNR